MPWQLFAVFAPTLGYLDIMLLCSAGGRQQWQDWEWLSGSVGRRQRCLVLVWDWDPVHFVAYCSASSSNTGPRPAVFDFTTLTTYLPPLLLNS